MQRLPDGLKQFMLEAQRYPWLLPEECPSCQTV